MTTHHHHLPGRSDVPRQRGLDRDASYVRFDGGQIRRGYYGEPISTRTATWSARRPSLPGLRRNLRFLRFQLMGLDDRALPRTCARHTNGPAACLGLASGPANWAVLR